MARTKSVKIKKPSPIRNKIISKARAIFGAKGYHNTTVKDIATAYGCEPANIYNFFPNKEEILYEILTQEMEAIIFCIRGIEDDETTDPVLQLKTIFECHGKVTLGKMRTSKVLFDASLRFLNKKHQKIIIEKRDEYDKLLRLVIKRGVDAKVFQTTDIKMASFAIASIIVRARVWYKSGGALSANSIIENLFLFALKALGCSDEKYFNSASTIK